MTKRGSKKRRSRSRSSSRCIRSKSVIRSKPLLWERIKKQVLKGDKGGSPGQWSARKAQLSVKLYKQKGGGYKSCRSRSNSLSRWSVEN